MSVVFIVAIVFGSIVTLAGLLCGTILVIVRMRQADSGSPASRDDAELVQELYRNLEKMEQRIEALETILMDAQDNHGEKQ
jgi:phage shock protein B